MGVLGERFEMRTGDGRERHLFERDRAELDQLRAEQIAALHLPQVARLHERADEAVSGAARRSERGAECAQVAGAVRGGFEDRESAQQGLRAGRCGVMSRSVLGNAIASGGLVLAPGAFSLRGEVAARLRNAVSPLVCAYWTSLYSWRLVD